MARSMIRNKLGAKTKTFYVPATDEQAQSFATDFLEGEWSVLSFVGEEGSDAVTTANDVNVMVKATDGAKTYFSFLADSSKDEDAIFTALKGLTINGVKVEEAYILGMRPVTFS
ncbi:hypothetical protein MNB_SM-7-1321 [hydrothermal vent metagenome]|uniref:Uncharacterized protein n=1 Tax=hydrothermal vent metagenome TaxID=652676 RepID=A0A1W1BXR9_9ZZZZ